VQGASITLLLTLFTVVIGTSLGVFLAFVKGSNNLVFSFLAKLYIELFRALPVLVLLIWIYYVVPILTDWRMSPFTAAVVGLSMNLGAFVAETVRAAIESIPHSQFESGLALGMSRGQTMRHVIVPQAVRNMIPNLLGLYITEIKNSSLASVIAVNEVLHRGNILISETYRPLEIYSTIAAVYLVIILPLIFLSRWAERHFSKGIKSTSVMNYETSH
jgi:polar amino acid transport system permease protein